MYYVKVLIFYNRNALKMKKEGIVRGQELMKTYTNRIGQL